MASPHEPWTPLLLRGKVAPWLLTMHQTFLNTTDCVCIPGPLVTGALGKSQTSLSLGSVICQLSTL